MKKFEDHELAIELSNLSMDAPAGSRKQAILKQAAERIQGAYFTERRLKHELQKTRQPQFTPPGAA